MAFVYGWVLLLVTQTGGMAAVAVTFARLLPGNQRRDLERQRDRGGSTARLTAINCFGRARRQ